MKTNRTVLGILAALLVVGIIFVLVNCAGSEVDSSIDSGKVVHKSGNKITVLEDDGERDTHRVSKSVYLKCSVGERWPNCKR